MMEYRLPPLRERRADIVPLALDFIRHFCSSHDVNVRRVHPDFFACLKAYEWPGNVRELKNHVRRAVLFCRTDFLTPNDLAVQIRQAAEKVPSGPPPQSKPTGLHGSQTLCDRVAHSERHILQEALRAHGNNRTMTARSLGLSRVGLYKKMKKYGMIHSRKGPEADSN
jgi:DNA-binding NtrC family response regulator